MLASLMGYNGSALRHVPGQFAGCQIIVKSGFEASEALFGRAVLVS